MQVVWEAEDIRPGRRVTKLYENAEVWIIGYDPERYSTEDNRLSLISLSDGMITHKNKTSEQMAEVLNASGNQPLDLILENRKWKR